MFRCKILRLLIYIILACNSLIECLTIGGDYENGCYDLHTAESMIKFDKAFRVSDTPYLNTCYNLCDNDLQCKVLAFGFDKERGNGTCILSSSEPDAKDLLLFEPRFNLYTRKRDCQSIPQPGSTPYETAGTTSHTSWTSVTGISDKTQFTTSGEFPTTSPGSSVPGGPTSSYPSSSSTTEGELYGGQQGSYAPNQQSSTTSRYGSTPIDRFTTTERYPSGPSTRPHSGYHNGGGPSNKPPTGYGTGYSTGHAESRPGYYGGTGTAHGYDGYSNREHSYQHPNSLGGPYYPGHISPVYPTYPYPVPYEKNYPLPNYPVGPPSSHSYETGGPDYYSGPSYPSIPSHYPQFPSSGNGYPSPPSSSGQTSNGGYGGVSKPTGPPEPLKNETGYMRPTSPGNGYNVHEIDQEKKPCFRRALAGKKVSEKWVKKTLICERVSDCQLECAEERRFRCEGFNYRLDPSGRGQGDCELIEAPLAQIDLYANGGSNVMTHPDYDYYERDRTASPSCYQPPNCIDCGSRRPGTTVRPIEYRPYPAPAPPAYPSRPSYPSPPNVGYGHRPGNAVDIYRPSGIYEPRPPLHPERPGPAHYPAPGYYEPQPNRPGYGTIDRVGIEEPDHHRPGTGYKPGPSKEPIYFGYPGPKPPGPPLKPGYPGPPAQKPYIPYSVGEKGHYGMRGDGYGHSHSGYYDRGQVDYWGLSGGSKRKEPPFNYNRFSGGHGGSTGYGYGYGGGGGGGGYESGQGNGYSYGGTSVAYQPGGGYYGFPSGPSANGGAYNIGNSWIRRPGVDDCSVKTSEGFRLHKGVVKSIISVNSIKDCERLCSVETGFKCQTYSYRYFPLARDNCFFSDRPYHHLDIYVDLEPDHDYDIYSMTDDPNVCKAESYPAKEGNAQCFFRSIDSNRLYKGVVRESLSVKSIGECEQLCVKADKLTCRAFTFRYGPQAIGSIPDNCQLSDWPVRDMDRDRHLIADPSFDVYERASYGHGCEIRPMADDTQNKKLCYLGYGSPAKLLSSAIKKVISVSSELECKNECVRNRESTTFKCMSFSYGMKATTFNCELSDLDQSELNLGVNYAHVNDRDYWLFAWNPYDFSCRDKVATVTGNRLNSDRRIDIFKDPGELTWSQFTVNGKPCRFGTKCEKNLISGFYSCEIEGGEIGSWDYCCRADHPCGYSQGFDYPWCYVGEQADQWRQCSDRYFPTTIRPITQLTSLPSQKKETVYHQKPPKPGGLQPKEIIKEMPKLWPVTYFYSEGPPINTTEMSNFIDCKQDVC